MSVNIKNITTKRAFMMKEFSELFLQFFYLKNNLLAYILTEF